MPLQNTRYIVREQGKPLKPETLERPSTLGPSEVLIRLKAIALNPADCKSIFGGHRVSNWPFVPGLDGAGIVEAVGDDVGNVAVGDEVLATFGGGGKGASYQNYAVVNAGNVARKPSKWSFEEASTVGVSYYTAVAALGIGLQTPMPFLQGGPQTGFTPTSVLVLGGSSALGAATIQLLRLALPDCTILVTSSPKHHGLIRDVLGADQVFDRGSASLINDVKSTTSGSRGVDAIVDTVGAGATERHVFDAFNPDGPMRYAQVWTGDDEIQVPDGVDSVMFRSRDVGQIPGGKNAMASLETLLSDGRYRVSLPVHHVGTGLDQLPKGVELMQKGASGEKLVVSV